MKLHFPSAFKGVVGAAIGKVLCIGIAKWQANCNSVLQKSVRNIIAIWV
jgi:hypothetical protein